MKNIFYLLTAGALLFSSTIIAQQANNFAFYKNQMNVINPAYAGIDNQTQISGSIRSQWTGVKEAPNTQAVSFGTPLGKNLGFGISVLNDQTFIEQQTSVGIDLSYLVKLSATTDLYFGVKAGGNSFNINSSGLEFYSVDVDPAFASINSFTPNVGVGAVLKSEKYFFSLSVPKLVSFKDVKNDDGYAMVSTNRPLVYASGGYDFNLNTTGSLVLKPSFMARYTSAAPVSVDFNTMLMINNNFEIGGLYRTDKAVAAMASITLSKRLAVGFAYEVSSRSELASARNTNEIYLRFKF